ncbi:Profilin/allergen [Pseudovirgaria hyperparasitica]|uniref:Profilin n=1 Tax=Pseudovirgaria hyperparasitica TaxID=470096 RepID=A0A6A6WI37_9PEZI|nr:Profilin/allergen [Pseudovirgaria hyperparasitica]KAF2761899.1 Profilin/allergen [Pseudovirgaria hyperparasitica]
MLTPGTAIAYVDSSLLGSGLVDNAIVFSRTENYGILAASPGYLVTQDELAEIRRIFADAGTGPSIQRARNDGFRVAGTTYKAVKGDSRSLYGRQGRQGIMVVNTNTAIFFVHYPESSSHSETANLIEQLCDYLISVGY